jgi:hypothetical protein
MSPDFLRQVCFSDESTFHGNGIVNRYTARFGAVKIHMRESPRVNVLTSLMHDKLIRPFFFLEKNVTGHSYLDALELCALLHYHLKLSSKKMGPLHISATMLGITWPKRELGDRSAEVDQSLAHLGRQI